MARTWLRNRGYASYPALEDHRLPKRVVSSFFHFLEDLRKKDPEIMALPLTEKSKVAGQKWKSLTPQEKKVRKPEETLIIFLASKTLTKGTPQSRTTISSRMLPRNTTPSAPPFSHLNRRW